MNAQVCQDGRLFSCPSDIVTDAGRVTGYTFLKSIAAPKTAADCIHGTNQEIMIVKKLLVPILALLAFAPAALDARASDDVEKLFVILTSPDTETQAMALVQSNQSARLGTPVHLMLCGPAGNIALKDTPAEAKKVITPKGMTVASLLEALKKKGAEVDVCAIYLPNRKLKADALGSGVGVARPPAIAAEMVAEGTRLATF